MSFAYSFAIITLFHCAFTYKDESMDIAKINEKSDYKPIAFSIRDISSDENKKYEFIAMGKEGIEISKLDVMQTRSRGNDTKVLRLEMLTLPRRIENQYFSWFTNIIYKGRDMRIPTGLRFKTFRSKIGMFTIVIMRFTKRPWGFVAVAKNSNPPADEKKKAFDEFDKLMESYAEKETVSMQDANKGE